MHEEKGNIWNLISPDDALCITTNGFVRRDGAAVMGRGIALQAKKRYFGVEFVLGKLIELRGNHVTYLGQPMGGPHLMSFPVKHRWMEDADPELIRRSAYELVELVARTNWPRFWLPRPGCGNGRLSWSEVRPILEPILTDRITVVSRHRDG